MWFPSTVKELLEILGDPAHEVCDAGVHTGILSLATADAPAHDADLHPAALVDHQWSSTVPLYQLYQMSVQWQPVTWRQERS